jgi:hypothetical protein
MIFRARKLVCSSMHLTGRTESTVASAVKKFTTSRDASQKTLRFYAFVVTLLALGLFWQAVHAKNSDYFPKTAQAVRFSTTVKIADLAHHVVVANPATLSVTREIVPLTQPRSTRASYVAEVPAQELSAQISFRPLRSPPVIL